MMYDLAKMFLYCFNHWKLETPSVHSRSSLSDNQQFYKENYSRYAIVIHKGIYCLVFNPNTCSMVIKWRAEGVVLRPVHTCTLKLVSCVSGVVSRIHTNTSFIRKGSMLSRLKGWLQVASDVCNIPVVLVLMCAIKSLVMNSSLSFVVC